MTVQVLGFGDFYYELGVQIVEACLATRSLNGGLMEMKPLMRFVNVSPSILTCCLGFQPMQVCAESILWDPHLEGRERLSLGRRWPRFP